MKDFRRYTTARAIEVIKARSGVTVTEVPCGTAFLDSKPRSRRRGPLTQNQMDLIRVVEEERLGWVIERDAKAARARRWWRFWARSAAR